MPPTTHASLGASSSHRWMACPGSVALSEGIPDSTSPYAIEGTAAHDLGEMALAKGFDCDVWLGTEIKVTERLEDGRIEVHHVEVTEEMCEAVQVYVDHVRKQHEAAGEGAELMLERKFDLSPLNPPGPMFGTSDAVIWAPTTRVLDISDYKHGQGVAVDATENSQLRYYALGAVVALNKKPDLIRMTIVQPRASHPAGIIRTDEMTWDELVSFKSELFAAGARTQEPDAPLVPGEHCRFCKAQAICPAQRKMAIEVAQSEFDVEPEPVLTPAEQLTEEQLALVLEKADLIRNWLGAVESHVVSLLDRGQEVVGWKLVEGRSNRRWKDEEHVETVLVGILGDEAHEKKLLSPAKAEKALKGIGTKLDPDLVEKPAGRPKLVPAHDARPALLPSAQDEFTADGGD